VNTHVKKYKARYFLWTKNNPEVNNPPLGSPRGSVSRGSIAQQATKKGLFLGTWNVRSLYMAVSLTAAARELAR
jgi:hypothetical protein